MQLLLVKCGAYNFGFNTSDLVTIINKCNTTKVPGASPFVQSIVTYSNVQRGLVSREHLFNIATYDYNSYAVCNNLVIAIEEIVKVFDMPESAVIPVGPFIDNKAFDGLCVSDGEIFFILNLSVIFDVITESEKEYKDDK